MSSIQSDIEAVVSHDHLSLEDWLVHTGFHDDSYREQELTRFRSIRETIRAVDQEFKELEENLLQLRLRHIPVYQEHMEMERQEADLLARSDQLRKVRADATAEPLPPIVLPPLQLTATGSSQDPPLEDGEILDTMIYSEQQDQPEQHEQHEQHEQPHHATPDFSKSPSLVLSPGSPYRTPSRDGSDRSKCILRGRELLGHNQSRGRTRSPDVRARPGFGRQEYRDRSNPSFYTEYHSPSNGLDLGTSSNTRFFLLKSVSISNVYASQRENVWACGYPTIEKLSEAFKNCKNVILFFSANRSFGFQGYARMLGTPSSQNSKPSWYSKAKWKISDPFPIEWIGTTSCAGDKVGGMRNSLVLDPTSTRGQLVVRLRDGDELDAPCGYAIKCILDQEARGASAALK